MKKVLMVLIVFSTILLWYFINEDQKYKHLSLEEKIVYDNTNYQNEKVISAFTTIDDNIIIYKVSYITKDEILVMDDFYYVKVSSIYNEHYIAKGLYQNNYMRSYEKQAIVEAMSYGIKKLDIRK